MSIKLLVVILLVISIIEALVFMWLWNWLVVWIFNVPHIDFCQSVGILVLLAIVGGFFKGRTK